MNKTRFDDLPDTTLLSFKEAAEFLGITERYVSALEIRGKLQRVKGVCFPRFLLSELRDFKTKAYETGFFPIAKGKEKVSIADPNVSDDTFVTLPVVAEYLGVQPQTVRLRIKRGSIPAPYRLFPNSRPKWRVGDIRAMTKVK